MAPVADAQQLTVSKLLRQYAADFVTRYRSQAAPQVQSTLAKLSLCRTIAMGGRSYRCDDCDRESMICNSCGDRHCPLCSGARRRDWMESTSALLIPGLRYFQVVFTIPDKLSSLALGNRRPIYDLLFHSAWQTLRDVIADEQHYEAAAAMVLHTWNQKLEAHAHVHALVPGGGPSLTGDRRWVTSRRPHVKTCDGTYLVDADALRRTFRENFLAGLQRLYDREELRLEGEWAWLEDAAAFEEWLKPLREVTWVASIEPPPTEQSTPEHVVKYLARYLTGGPISDRRLVSHDNGHVTFIARKGTKSGGSAETEPVTISGVEFVRRWSLHILPKGYTKTRRFGGFSNRHRDRYLPECRELLAKIAPSASPAASDPSAVTDAVTDAATDAATDAGTPSEAKAVCCPHCGNAMRVLDVEPRRSWRKIMRSRQRPVWYKKDG